MRVKARLTAINLINKAKEYPSYISGMGVQAELKKTKGISECFPNKDSGNIVYEKNSEIVRTRKMDDEIFL